MAALKLTPARLFCLEEVARRKTTTWDVCKNARRRGMSANAGLTFEWADKHFLALRKAGLIERTGDIVSGRRVHQITAAGRLALAMAKDTQ